MIRTRRRPHTRQPRDGHVAMIAVPAILVVFAITALVVDRQWLHHAGVELEASADACCLAAARTLVDDATLEEDVDWGRIVERALENAQRTAQLNPVARGRLVLQPGPDGDVWFGRDVLDRRTGQERFVFTDHAPTTVVVRARRTRDANNPVTTLLSGLFGLPEANVSTLCEVTVDNHVLGVRALEHLPVPALPLGIRASGGEGADDSGEEPATTDGTNANGGASTETADGEPNATDADSWDVAIERRRGPDEYGWDAERKRVVREPDGLPEIVVRPMSRDRGPEEANVQLLDFASDFRFDVLDEQIERGLTTEHLEPHDGELLLDGRRIPLRCSALFDHRVVEMLERAIGHARLCLLYEDHVPSGQLGEGTLEATRLVAVRILDVRRRNGDVELVLQPAVVPTRTAILLEDWQWNDDEDAFRNPYVYKLTVTE